MTQITTLPSGLLVAADTMKDVDSFRQRFC